MKNLKGLLDRLKIDREFFLWLCLDFSFIEAHSFLLFFPSLTATALIHLIGSSARHASIPLNLIKRIGFASIRLSDIKS
jgi:hypothetical protein